MIFFLYPFETAADGRVWYEWNYFLIRTLNKSLTTGNDKREFMAFWKLLMSQWPTWMSCVCVCVCWSRLAFMNVEQPVANWKPSCATSLTKRSLKWLRARSVPLSWTMMSFYLFVSAQKSPSKGTSEAAPSTQTKMFHVGAVGSFLLINYPWRGRFCEWVENKTMKLFCTVNGPFYLRALMLGQLCGWCGGTALSCHRNRNSNLKGWHVGKMPWVQLQKGAVDRAT